LAKGVALFASEWGTCSFDGNGTLDLEETRLWLDFLEHHNISDANWAVNDKLEACSALLPGTSGSGGWPLENLTDSGRFLRDSLRQPLVYWPAETPRAAEQLAGNAGRSLRSSSTSDSDLGSLDEDIADAEELPGDDEVHVLSGAPPRSLTILAMASAAAMAILSVG